MHTLPPAVVVNCSVWAALLEVIALSFRTPFTFVAVRFPSHTVPESVVVFPAHAWPAFARHTAPAPAFENWPVMLPANVSVRLTAPPPVFVAWYDVVASCRRVVAPMPPTPWMFTQDAVIVPPPFTV